MSKMIFDALFDDFCQARKWSKSVEICLDLDVPESISGV